MNSLTIIIPVREGRLDPSDPQKHSIAEFLRQGDKKAVSVKFSVPKKPRSLKANAFYWSAILPAISAHTGHTTEEMHYFFRDLLLPKKFICLGGREIEIRKSTADLSSAEFTTYLTSVAAFAAQNLGVVIPEAR